MEKKRLTNIISDRYVRKVNKYVVELAVYQEPKIKVWLTEKQMINLHNCFSEIGWNSNKHSSVFAYFNDNGYYAYANISQHPQPRQFKQPFDHDLSDLEDN